jgi:hypothetical protein
MSNLTSSRIGSPEPSSARPAAAQPAPPPPGSQSPLRSDLASPSSATLPATGVDGSAKSDVQPSTIGPPSAPDATPHPIRERNHELIDFLVRRAIGKCMPADADPSSLRSSAERTRFAAPQLGEVSRYTPIHRQRRIGQTSSIEKLNSSERLCRASQKCSGQFINHLVDRHGAKHFAAELMDHFSDLQWRSIPLLDRYGDIRAHRELLGANCTRRV